MNKATPFLAVLLALSVLGMLAAVPGSAAVAVAYNTTTTTPTNTTTATATTPTNTSSLSSHVSSLSSQLSQFYSQHKALVLLTLAFLFGIAVLVLLLRR